MADHGPVGSRWLSVLAQAPIRSDERSASGWELRTLRCCERERNYDHTSLAFALDAVRVGRRSQPVERRRPRERVGTQAHTPLHAFRWLSSLGAWHQKAQ